MKTYKQIDNTLLEYWMFYGVNYRLVDMTVIYGAATFDINNVLSVFKKHSIIFKAPCYRPTDGNSNTSIRSAIFHQMQVLIFDFYNIMKYHKTHVSHIAYNSIKNIIGAHCFEMLEDNWNAPTMKSFGIGWEYRVNGLEVLQITKFKKFWNKNVCDYCVYEFTYGLERLYYLANVTYDVSDVKLDVVEQYNNMSSDMLVMKLDNYALLQSNINYYEFLVVNLIFNILDARQYFNIFEKNLYMKVISELVTKVVFNFNNVL